MQAPTPLFDIYLDPAFLAAAECAALIAQLSDAQESRAPVYGRGGGGTVDERMRKVAQLAPARATVDRIEQLLLQARGKVASHFGVPLSSCEAPQFLRYREGDFFVAHQDGNTGMLHGGKEQSRKVSLVVFLNEPDAYAGGTLRFTEWRAGRTRGEWDLVARTGMLAAFMADTTHEVTPVARGERFTIAGWYG